MRSRSSANWRRHAADQPWQSGQRGHEDSVVLVLHFDDRDQPACKGRHRRPRRERRDDPIAAGFGKVRLQDCDERHRPPRPRDRIVEHVKLAHRYRLLRSARGPSLANEPCASTKALRASRSWRMSASHLLRQTLRQRLCERLFGDLRQINPRALCLGVEICIEGEAHGALSRARIIGQISHRSSPVNSDTG